MNFHKKFPASPPKGKRHIVVKLKTAKQTAPMAKVSKPAGPQPASDQAKRPAAIPSADNGPAIGIAGIALAAFFSNAAVAAAFSKSQLGDRLELVPLAAAMAAIAERVNNGDMREVEATLATQAAALNVIFGELGRRAAVNMHDFPEASERYLRMALKAQNQCRMTLETLSNVKNPPVIYARQANIANGPQQVNNGADPALARAGESRNQPNKLLDESNEQRMDQEAQGPAGRGDLSMEALAERNRAQDPGRQGQGGA